VLYRPRYSGVRDVFKFGKGISVLARGAVLARGGGTVFVLTKGRGDGAVFSWQTGQGKGKTGWIWFNNRGNIRGAVGAVFG
jgi:hypothetical protein